VGYTTAAKMINELIPVLQAYAWGARKGANSVVEQLITNQKHVDGASKNVEHYAELWMGCHPNGMAKILKSDGNKQPINEFIQDNQFADITYMFKVLSVEKPLSLQLHPSKEVAEKLHAEFPNIYKDDNHKPEISVALSDEFHALAGFKTIRDVFEICEEYPLLHKILFGDEKLDVADSCDTRLKQALKNLVQPSDTPEDVKNHIEEMTRLTKQYQGDSTVIKEFIDVFNMLVEEYPHDKSVFSAAIMIKHVLKKGECLFLNAGLLHAYLKGDCIECMASSDNVIRGGLTPKYIDVENLLKYTDFVEGGSTMINPRQLSTSVTLYEPPVDDFTVRRIVVNGIKEKYTSVNLETEGVAIAVFLNGTGTIECSDTTITIEKGLCVNLSPGFEFSVEGEDIDMWIASH